MLFNSFEFFLIYLPIVVSLFFIIGRWSARAAALFVGVASLAFLAVWEVRYAAVLVLSILFNYAAAQLIAAQTSATGRKVALIASITVNLCVIFFYKYLDFSIESVNGLTGAGFSTWDLVLPLGISFYTFTQTAFLVDTYRREVADFNFVRYVLFVTYFPHLIAGPILHHGNIIPQFAKTSTYQAKAGNIATGLVYFTIGLAKKVLLADSFAVYATPVFSAADTGNEIGAAAAWSGALAYTFQIYFDFSGYSDMAVGLAKMMNTDIPQNFNSPYKASSIIEFWRRWHMSLSAFLRDYVYIPLGGSRRGSRYINLMTTMLVGGLWHGASWTFVLWGGLHGLYLVVNHWLGGIRLPFVHPLWGRIAGHLLTFFAVVLAWTFFRAETFSGALSIISSMASVGFMDRTADASSTLVSMFDDEEAPFRIAAFMLAGFAISWFAPNAREIVCHASNARSAPFFAIGVALVVILVLLSINASRGISEFIYFNF